MPFLKQFLTFSQKFPFLKNIFGTSCDFHKFAEKFSKNFEPLYPLDFWLIYCGPMNIQITENGPRLKKPGHHSIDSLTFLVSGRFQ